MVEIQNNRSVHIFFPRRESEITQFEGACQSDFRARPLAARRRLRLKRIAPALLSSVAFLFLLIAEGTAAPLPYFGKEGAILAGPIQRGTFESLNSVQLGGESITDNSGRDQRLFLFSWERDFVLDLPTLSFLNVLVDSGEARLTWEFPAFINPYVVLIGENSFFYQDVNKSDPLQIAKFRGVGAGAGVMKRTEEALNFRLGAEWVTGTLRGAGGRDAGARITEFVQFEIDHLQKSTYDEPVDGVRLFVSLSNQFLEGFFQESETRNSFLQGIEEKYIPIGKKTTVGLVAREGQQSNSGRHWTTTFGSFQEDEFNIPLPGYFYQQLPAKRYLNGEAHLRSWITPFLLGHLAYYAAGGWDNHLYTSSTVGITYLVFGKLPLFAEGAFGHSPAGGTELLLGTALQW